MWRRSRAQSPSAVPSAAASNRTARVGDEYTRRSSRTRRVSRSPSPVENDFTAPVPGSNRSANPLADANQSRPYQSGMAERIEKYPKAHAAADVVVVLQREIPRRRFADHEDVVRGVGASRPCRVVDVEVAASAEGGEEVGHVAGRAWQARRSRARRRGGVDHGQVRAGHRHPQRRRAAPVVAGEDAHSPVWAGTCLLMHVPGPAARACGRCPSVSVVVQFGALVRAIRDAAGPAGRAPTGSAWARRTR